jgi:hypothetical protein
MRCRVFILLGAVALASCSSKQVDPLALESGPTTTSPLQRPDAPPAVASPSVEVGPGSQDYAPEAPVLVDPASAPKIGEFCDDQLSPIRDLLDEAERNSGLTQSDHARLQALLDGTGDSCTPTEYVVFQQELLERLGPPSDLPEGVDKPASP